MQFLLKFFTGISKYYQYRNYEQITIKLVYKNELPSKSRKLTFRHLFVKLHTVIIV